MPFACIETDRVVEVVRVDPHGIFAPGYADKFVEAPEGVEVGWLADGETLKPPLPAVVSPQQLRAQLAERATVLRWQHEQGGLTLSSGVRVATGRDDQNRITSVIANAGLAGVESVDFKAASGWTTLTMAELRDIAAAIALHVQACFSAERAHHQAIAAMGTLEELAAYDVTAGWPASPV